MYDKITKHLHDHFTELVIWESGTYKSKNYRDDDTYIIIGENNVINHISTISGFDTTVTSNSLSSWYNDNYL